MTARTEDNEFPNAKICARVCVLKYSGIQKSEKTLKMWDLEYHLHLEIKFQDFWEIHNKEPLSHKQIKKLSTI